jgi:hypothetical protein
MRSSVGALRQQFRGTCATGTWVGALGYLRSSAKAHEQQRQGSSAAASDYLQSSVSAHPEDLQICRTAPSEHLHSCFEALGQMVIRQSTCLEAVWNLHSAGGALEQQRFGTCAAASMNLSISDGNPVQQRRDACLHFRGTCAATSGNMRRYVRAPEQ